MNETTNRDDQEGGASAVKMCTASVYKGTVALLTQALLTAHANGVLAFVLDDLGELADGAGRTIARSATKSGRYVGEMHEIASTQAAAGLTPELFEKYLPYAIALDVENAWGKRFEGILAAMAIDPNRDDSWYRGRDDWRNDPQRFTNYLGSTLRETVASAATPPGSSGGSDSSSSGSDGGGSSGGGGGGGGGSGW